MCAASVGICSCCAWFWLWIVFSVLLSLTAYCATWDGTAVVGDHDFQPHFCFKGEHNCDNVVLWRGFILCRSVEYHDYR